MPSLEQRNGNYRLIVRLGGRKFTRSLNTRDLREAEALRYRAEDNLRRLKHGILALPPGADLVSFLLSDGRTASPVRSSGSITTLGTLCDKYEDNITEGSQEASSLHCLRVHLRHFKRVLGTRFRVHSITHLDLDRYVKTRARSKGRRGKKVSKNTIKKEIATLNTVWRWANRNHIIQQQLPIDGLRYPKDDERPPFQTIHEVLRKTASGHLTDEQQADLWDSVYLTVEEIKELLDHVRKVALHPCLYPMFATAAFTGARCSELRRSRVDDVNVNEGSLWLSERKRVPGRRSLRTVPIFGELREILEKWLNQQHPGGTSTFCLSDVLKSRKTTSAPRPLTSEEARHHFHQTLLGTKWEKLHGWHVFRHSFCSNCAAAGTDQRLIDEWVGHQTEEMRKRYRHIFPSKQREALSKVFS